MTGWRVLTLFCRQIKTTDDFEDKKNRVHTENIYGLCTGISSNGNVEKEIEEYSTMNKTSAHLKGYLVTLN